MKNSKQMAAMLRRHANAGHDGFEHVQPGKVGRVMGEFEAGDLHSGSKHGPTVTSRAQAVAIGLSEARKAGESVPRKRKRSR